MQPKNNSIQFKEKEQHFKERHVFYTLLIHVPLKSLTEESRRPTVQTKS